MSGGDGLQQMVRLVNQFINRADTVAFRTPVDPKAMNIPDYFHIVKNPMDLGTVKSNLEAGRYDSAESVARDIRLIWDNCILYNSKESEFGVLASSLKKKFEEKYSKIAEKERDKKAPGRPDPVDARPPSLEEKVQFTYDLYRVTPMEVGQVMEQVDARCPHALKASVDNEVELNVDMMDAVTFRVVERVIHDALHRTSTVEGGSVSGGLSDSSSGRYMKTGGGTISKKKRSSDGESRHKKQRA